MPLEQGIPDQNHKVKGHVKRTLAAESEMREGSAVTAHRLTKLQATGTETGRGRSHNIPKQLRAQCFFVITGGVCRIIQTARYALFVKNLVCEFQSAVYESHVGKGH